jgi:hypothetical protein
LLTGSASSGEGTILLAQSRWIYKFVAHERREVVRYIEAADRNKPLLYAQLARYL